MKYKVEIEVSDPSIIIDAIDEDDAMFEAVGVIEDQIMNYGVLSVLNLTAKELEEE